MDCTASPSYLFLPEPSHKMLELTVRWGDVVFGLEFRDNYLSLVMTTCAKKPASANC